MVDFVELDIMQALPTGEKNTVTRQEFCERYGLTERERRRLFERLRRNGAVICSSNSGLFKPADAAEVKKYLHRAEAFVSGILLSVKAARELSERWSSE